MHSFEHRAGSLSFTFFGVPTVIRPSSWLMLLILGSGVGSARVDIMPMLVFVVAGMLCLLVHEYGHAFSCRALGGGSSAVEIASLGGVTVSSYPPSTRRGHLLMVLAGPGASLLIAVLAGAVLGLYTGVAPLKGVVYALTAPLPFDPPREMQEWCYIPIWSQLHALDVSLFAITCYHTLFFVSVWWSLFNLLPIFPMDGGKALLLYTDNPRLTGMVGLTVAILLGVWGLTQGLIFTVLICAWFVWINWQYIRLSR